MQFGVHMRVQSYTSNEKACFFFEIISLWYNASFFVNLVFKFDTQADDHICVHPAVGLFLHSRYESV